MPSNFFVCIVLDKKKSVFKWMMMMLLPSLSLIPEAGKRVVAASSRHFTVLILSHFL